MVNSLYVFFVLAYLCILQEICIMKQYIKNIIFKEFIWFRVTSKITEDSIKPGKIELEKDYDNTTQNDHDDEEEYDPVPCELKESKMMFVCQSNVMQRLYRWYASTSLLLDATYRVTKYFLPLYSFDKCLLSTHFLFSKSWNLHEVFRVFQYNFFIMSCHSFQSSAVV